MSQHWSTAEFVYTPAQEKIFRAVAGAVVNAAHGHPDWKLNKTIARSIAKRAAGTLCANWPEVLAARLLSERGESCPISRPPRAPRGSGRAKRGASLVKRRSPFNLVHNAVGAMAGEAKRTGQPERAEALIEVLRLVAKLRDQEQSA